MRSIHSIIIFLIFSVFSVSSAAIINVLGDYSAIQIAIDAAVDNDTVLVADGIYTENINFSGKAILVTSQNGPQNTTILIQTSGSPVVTFNSGEGPGSVLSGFTVDGDSSLWGVYIDSTFPVIYNNIIENHEVGIRVEYGGPIIRKNKIRYCSHSQIFPRNGGGIRMTDAYEAIIDSNEIYDNFSDVAAGIYLYACNGVTVNRNLIYSNNSIYIGGLEIAGCDSIGVFNNTLVHNSSAGPILGSINISNSSDIDIINNISAFNDEYGMRNYQGNSNLYTAYNDVYLNNPGNYYNLSPGPGSISENPRFLNLLNNDLILQLDSPCINAGDPSFPLDPDGTVSDMGALFSNLTTGFGSLAGIVSDRDGSPIESVYVSIQDTVFNYWTGPDGYYYFGNIPAPQLIDVEFSHPDFADILITGMSIYSNDTTNLDVSMYLPITIHVPGDFPTIQEAIYSSSSKDTILVADGIYTENIDFSGKSLKVISENGPSLTTIQIQTPDIEVVAITNGEGPGTELSGFTIDGDSSYWGIHISGASALIYGNIIKNQEVGIRVGTSPGTIIRKNEIKYCSHLNIEPRNGGAIRLVNSNGAIIDSNEIHDNYSDVAGGIFLYNCDDVIVYRNLIYSNSSRYIGGIEISSCDSIHVYNNTIVDNLSSEITLGSINMSNSNDIDIINNICAFNNEYGICNYQFNTNLFTSYNDVYGNLPNDYYNWSPGTGSISSNPAFADMGSANFELLLNSPCINSGDPSFPLDPDGTVSDMGAIFRNFEAGFGSLAGTVTDIFSAPIESVHVSIPDPILEYWTGADGYYFFDNIPAPQLIDVQFSHPDFADSLITDISIFTDDTTNLDLLMLAPVTIHVPGDFPTIQQALDLSTSSDTILVADGIYTENINFLGKSVRVTSENGASFTTIQIQTPNVAVVTFSGGEGPGTLLSGFTINGDSSYWGIHINDASPLIYGNVIKNHEAGIKVDGGGSPIIRKNEISLCSHSYYGPRNGGAIRLEQSDGAIIDSNVIHDNYADVAAGILLLQCSNILVERNLIYSNSSIYIGGLEISSCDSIYVYNNTFADNSSSGPILGSINCSLSDYVMVINNISAFNSEYGICNYQSNTNLYTSYNDVYGNSPNDYYNWSPGTGSISLDPLFVDQGNGVLELTEDSPCVDAGDPSFPLDPDLTVSDMGALYFNSITGPFGVIAGIVSDSTQLPIEAAVANVQGTGVSDTTDGSGRYYCRNIGPGTYNVSFSHPGYATLIINDVVVTVGEMTIVNATLLEQTGCEYNIGDVNNSGAFNGLDVTYGVNFFKGGAAPLDSCDCPPHGTWYASGDVNSSCSYNGLDVTYGVSFLKGGPDLVPCEDCPPAGVLLKNDKTREASK